MFQPKYIHFVYSYENVTFPSCLRREDQFVVVFFFSHEEHEDMLLSW